MLRLLTYEQPSPSYQQCPLQINFSDDPTLGAYYITIGAKEQQLWLVVQINDRFFDTRGLARNQEVDDGLHQYRLVVYLGLVSY